MFVGAWVCEFFGHLVFGPVFSHLTVWRAPLIRIGHHLDQPSAHFLIDRIQLIKDLLNDVATSLSASVNLPRKRRR